MSFLLVILSLYLYINFTRPIPVNEKIDKSSKYYTNDIYMSDGRIYSDHMNEYERKAYDTLIKMTKSRKGKIDINISEYDGMKPKQIGKVFETAHEAIIIDHPELMPYSSFYYRYTNTELSIYLEYAINNFFLEEINTLKIRRIIDDIKIKTKDMTELEKIKYVYEWIGDNNEYDRLFTYASKNQSIYNVFIKGNAVCAGFAKTSQVIFQNIGIESMTITGRSTGPHMWNIIRYNDKYYYFDSTYAASIRNKNNQLYYDGLKQEKMNYYKPYHPKWYFEIEKTNIEGL